MPTNKTNDPHSVAIISELLDYFDEEIGDYLAGLNAPRVKLIREIDELLTGGKAFARAISGWDLPDGEHARAEEWLEAQPRHLRSALMKHHPEHSQKWTGRGCDE
jgi:hypothetical protein